jgi:hypothetical protein
MNLYAHSSMFKTYPEKKVSISFLTQPICGKKTRKQQPISARHQQDPLAKNMK